jgi:RluA family pseudouridine synthase
MVPTTSGTRFTGYAVGAPQTRPDDEFQDGEIVISTTIKLSSPATREFWEVPVLYEDGELLALDKPIGLAVSPSREDPIRPSLIQLLHSGIAEGKPWATIRALSYLMNPHRLDLEVSGVLLLAKSKPVLVKLANLFGSETPAKRYVALAQGSPREERFEVGAKLAAHPARAGFVRVDARHGKRARTRFQVLERFAGWTLLKCELLTDRPHQVRVHLQNLGLPLAGDSLYGGQPLLLSELKAGYHLKPNKTERPLISRPALHAEEIAIAHPQTGKMVTITSPWPKDLNVGIKYLRRYP